MASRIGGAASAAAKKFLRLGMGTSSQVSKSKAEKRKMETDIRINVKPITENYRTASASISTIISGSTSRVTPTRAVAG